MTTREGGAESVITQRRIKEALDYDPATGVFRWRVPTTIRVKVGQVAGTVNTHGYIQIRIDGITYHAHRLAWLFIYGELPGPLDHIDGAKTNNCIDNLRTADKSENAANSKRRSDNTSGYKGVTFCRQTGLWRAQLHHNGRGIHIGRFATREDAHAAYKIAAEKYFGEFARGD